MDEYYLTRAERSIFKNKASEILEELILREPFRLVELGAGDGAKTKILLRYFLDKKVNFNYSPVDISANVLEILETSIKKELPQLQFNSIAGDYFTVLKELKFKKDSRLVVFFLGSNIGNYISPALEDFLKRLHDNLNSGDLVLYLIKGHQRL